MKILVALSGGVDSSVVAHLLKKQGHDLVGVQFRLWEDPLAPPLARVLPSKCCHEATQGRAKKVAEDLGIPLHHIDLSEEFKRKVVDPFLEGYRNGRTPNPCISCNRTIKFGRLLHIADELECGKLATGHYARVASDTGFHCTNVLKTTVRGRYVLLEAVDTTKDQSYYLYGLNQKQLSRVIFPLGSMEKQDVFQLAKKFKISLPERYIESQDLCFFPEKEPHDFLDRHLQPLPGAILDTGGKRRGAHRGLPHYTEGQRRRLGLGGLKIPLHVIRKDVATNTITVGTKEEAMRSMLTARALNWISWVPSEGREHTFDARIHSLGKRHGGTLMHDGATMRFCFFQPQLGISPGQSIVLYRGEEIVGGGVIEEASVRP